MYGWIPTRNFDTVIFRVGTYDKDTTVNTYTKTTLLAIVGILIIVGGRAKAEGSRQVGDSRFPTTLSVDGVEFPLRDGGLVRYWGFRVYCAALYAPKGSATAGAILDDATTRALQLAYHRKVGADDIVKASNKLIDKNPDVNRAPIDANLKTLFSWFKDVDDGDRYTAVHLPPETFVLLRNRREVGRLNDAAMSRAFFGIWLSETCLSESLRGSMLADQ